MVKLKVNINMLSTAHHGKEVIPERDLIEYAFYQVYLEKDFSAFYECSNLRMLFFVTLQDDTVKKTVANECCIQLLSKAVAKFDSSCCKRFDLIFEWSYINTFENNKMKGGHFNISYRRKRWNFNEPLRRIIYFS